MVPSPCPGVQFITLALSSRHFPNHIAEQLWSSMRFLAGWTSPYCLQDLHILYGHTEIYNPVKMGTMELTNPSPTIIYQGTKIRFLIYRCLSFVSSPTMILHFHGNWHLFATLISHTSQGSCSVKWATTPQPSLLDSAYVLFQYNFSGGLLYESCVCMHYSWLCTEKNRNKFSQWP